MKLPKKGKLVIAKWLDSASDCDWTYRPERHGLAVCTTVGFLADADKERVVIAATNSEHGQWGGRYAIPRQNLTDVRLLKVGKRAR